jgi:phage terminase Nu1 subunit (DNA packaging protein)
MIEEKIISATELGTYLGISGRAVRELALKGVLTKTKRGRYRVPESIGQYCAHLRLAAAGRGGEGAIAHATTERARLLKAQADAQEARNAAAIGALLDAGGVEREWSNIIKQSRAAVLAVPSRCQQRLPHLTAHDVDEIDLELREALRELGEGGTDGADRNG